MPSPASPPTAQLKSAGIGSVPPTPPQIKSLLKHYPPNCQYSGILFGYLQTKMTFLIVCGCARRRSWCRCARRVSLRVTIDDQHRSAHPWLHPASQPRFHAISQPRLHRRTKSLWRRSRRMCMDATVTVTDVTAVGPETVAIEFESPKGFSAQPGQFVKLLATVDGEEYARFYTLSSPDVTDSFEITVEIDPDESGPFSDHLDELTAGDAIEMSGPFGSDYYEGEPRVVVLAGGPGIGPAVGIAERTLDDGGEVAVVYRAATPAHEERLATLEERGAAVTILDGEITATVADVVTGNADEQVFVYGFAEFVDDAAA